MKRARGFTLVETATAIFLSSIIFLGLVSIFGSTYRFQKQAIYKEATQDGALFSVQAITRDLQRTSYLASPCPGGACNVNSPQGSDVLSGCVNFDSTQGVIDASQPVRVYSYCVDATNDMYYTWFETSNPGACPPAPAGACGPNYSIPGGDSIRLAHGISRDASYACGAAVCGNPASSACFFCRPANVSNMVEQHYIVSVPPASPITVNTASTIAKPINAPTP